jgi:hypothetical protein
LRTGAQLKERLSQVSAQPSAKVALEYFAGSKLSPDPNGLAEIRFRQVNVPDYYSLFLIPFVEAPHSDQKHLILYADGPLTERSGGNSGIEVTGAIKSTNRPRVLLGTVSTEINKLPEVKDEKIVTDGKVQPGNGHLKSFVKCSVVGCVPAGAGCLYGGPSWLPCFCLWCGGSIVSCGFLEFFFPGS